jgi:UDP-glucose 4-epimerase
VIDDLSRGHRELVPAGAAFVQADIADGEAVGQIAEQGIDACIHLSGYIEVAESVAEPELYLENNARKTERLLDALVDHDVTRFVFSSSAAVYGVPETVPIPVDHPRRPANPYGRSKAEAEDAIVARAGELRYALLRYFNPAGGTADRGEAHPHESHLIPLALDAAAGRREAFTVYGTDYPTRDGTCIRDFMHVVDLAEAHLKGLDALERHDAVVCNVGTGNGSTVMEVVESCRGVTGRELPVVLGERRAGDVPELVADPTAATALLGWEPRYTDLDEIVGSAWEWHRRYAARDDAVRA